VKRARGALRAASLALVLAPSGCAIVMNGFTDKIKVKTSTPGARVYVDGLDATNGVVVVNDRPHVVLVRAAGYQDGVVLVAPTVQAAPIVLDVILAVPSFLIAPLVDLAIGDWRAIDSPKAPIDLTPVVAAEKRPRPAYAVVDKDGTPMPARPAIVHADPPPARPTAPPPVAPPPVAPPPVAPPPVAPPPASPPPSDTFDTVYMIDGDILVGTIVGEDAKTVSLMLKDGHGEVVPRSAISRIQRKAPK
jgi:hypothetical protein